MFDITASLDSDILGKYSTQDGIRFTSLPKRPKLETICCAVYDRRREAQRRWDGYATQFQAPRPKRAVGTYPEYHERELRVGISYLTAALNFVRDIDVSMILKQTPFETPDTEFLREYERQVQNLLNTIWEMCVVLQYRTCTAELPASESDSTGDALKGRIEHLKYAGHLLCRALWVVETREREKDTPFWTNDINPTAITARLRTTRFLNEQIGLTCQRYAQAFGDAAIECHERAQSQTA